MFKHRLLTCDECRIGIFQVALRHSADQMLYLNMTLRQQQNKLLVLECCGEFLISGV